MGKKWDGTGIAYDINLWKECLRVLRPGGYLLAFGGSRTYHRMACAIEDAGFICHPMIAWCQGQGFPKASSLSRAFDRDNGIERGSAYIPDNENEIYGAGKSKAAGVDRTPGAVLSDPPKSPEAIAWDGWYYGRQSMKPAIEPIAFFQKPLEGRMVDNVRKWGCGAINVDQCRISANDFAPKERVGATTLMEERPWNRDQLESGDRATIIEGNSLGRWPANFLLSHSSGCVRLGEKKVKCSTQGHGESSPYDSENTWNVSKTPDNKKNRWHADATGHETVASWECEEGCLLHC